MIKKGKFKKVSHAVVVTDGGSTIVKFGSVREICDSFGVGVPLITESVPDLIEDKLQSEGHQAKAKFLPVSQAFKLSKRLNDSHRQVCVL